MEVAKVLQWKYTNHHDDVINILFIIIWGKSITNASSSHHPLQVKGLSCFNSQEQSPSLEDTSRSSGQWIPRFLLNPKTRYSFHRGPPDAEETTPLPPFSFRSSINIPSMLWFSNCLFPSQFSTEFLSISHILRACYMPYSFHLTHASNAYPYTCTLVRFSHFHLIAVFWIVLLSDVFSTSEYILA